MAASRLLHWGLWSMTWGALLSGPVALLVVGAVHPPAPWRTASDFASEFHSVELLPFVLGLLLVAGCLTTIAGLHELAEARHKPRTTLALLFAACFGALIFFNYVVELTFVPVLARPYLPENGPLLAALSMRNPRSLAWGLEMSGYALFGVATWLCAPVLDRGSALSKGAAWCFVANGPVSIAGAVGTALGRDWLLQTWGLCSFGVWNLLVIAMGVLAARALKPSLPTPMTESLAR